MSDLPSAADVVRELDRAGKRTLRAKDLARALHVPEHAYRAFKKRLRGWSADGTIKRVKGGRYTLRGASGGSTGSRGRAAGGVTGRVSVTGKGDAFLSPESPHRRDIFVPARNLGSAMDGDRVRVEIDARPRGRSPVGSVVDVVERARERLVGRLVRAGNATLVEPRDRKLRREVLIPREARGDARPGDVVLVHIESFGDRRSAPTGRVLRTLGRPDEPGVDVLAVALDHDLPVEFPSEVVREAEAVAEARRPSQDGRVDRRDLYVFTIDPSDARDHDDALSLTRDGDGHEVGIHIADVTSYVDEGGALDREARSRGTSVYLVDRVLPMLPEALSAGVCSLVDGEDRHAVSLFVRLDGNGAPRGHRLERTLIRSRHRLSYEDAQAALDGGSDLPDEAVDTLHGLNRIAAALRSRRSGRGSIDLDLPEARVELDVDGTPIDVQPASRTDAHRLVEDFMLLANQVVAREAEERGLPVLYRVHEPPGDQALERLGKALEVLGLGSSGGSWSPRRFQEVLRRADGPKAPLANMLVLRAMERARYAEENLGHFGLALDHYCHFTSPIRRYPDLVTHRALLAALVDDEAPGEAHDMAALAEHVSLREREAADAERESIDVKKVQFMERFVGESFTGTISNVLPFGFFVALDRYFVEGLVHVSSLDDDFYELREEELALVGDRRGRRYRLGDEVRVVVSRVDRVARHVDLVLEAS